MNSGKKQHMNDSNQEVRRQRTRVSTVWIEKHKMLALRGCWSDSGSGFQLCLQKDAPLNGLPFHRLLY